jgi:hypothetical protein
MAKEIEGKIYAALGLNQDLVKTIEPREDAPLQAVEPVPAARGRAA